MVYSKHYQTAVRGPNAVLQMFFVLIDLILAKNEKIKSIYFFLSFLRPASKNVWPPLIYSFEIVFFCVRPTIMIL